MHKISELNDISSKKGKAKLAGDISSSSSEKIDTPPPKEDKKDKKKKHPAVATVQELSDLCHIKSAPFTTFQAAEGTAILLDTEGTYKKTCITFRQEGTVGGIIII